MTKHSNLTVRLSSIQKASQLDPGVVAAFQRFVEEAPEDDLFRTNPVRYGKEHGVEENVAIELFLHAAHAGILDLTWGVLCPACGGFLTSEAGLKTLANARECSMCEVDLPSRLDGNVEVTFTVNPAVRTLRFHDPSRHTFDDDAFLLYWSRSIKVDPQLEQGMMASVKHTARIGPKEAWAIEQSCTELEYVVFVPGDHAVGHLEVVDGGPAEVSLDLLHGELVPLRQPVGRGKVKITVHNRGQSPAVAGLLVNPVAATRPKTREARNDFVQHGDPMWTLGPFFSGKRLLTSQTFRDLFRADSVPSGSGLELKSLTLLFTDLKGSTEMYERIGDLKAFNLVREHFDILRGVVARNGGAVVKTMGDAIMASFPDPLPAMEAAALMNREVKKVGTGEDIVLKIGLHSGPCIAVDSNDRLDYFGQTVNIAARVQGIAGGSEIVATEPVMNAQGVGRLVEANALKPRRDQAALKGVDGLVTVYRMQ